ncbi:MAG: C25 family cysteine peptidase [Candidatus Glassbacteria bacterium]
MRKFVLSLIALSLVLILPLGLNSAGRWIPTGDTVDPVQTSLQVLSSDVSELVFEVYFQGLSVDDTETKGGMFLRIEIPGEGFTTLIGSPRLPVFKRFFEAPYGAKLTASIIDREVVEYSLDELGEAARIIPLQEPVPKTYGALEDAPFIIEESRYRVDRFWPDALIEVEDSGYLRGHRIGLVKLNAVSYNPVRSKIRFITRATIRVRMSGGNPDLTRQAVGRLYSRRFEDMLSNVLINYPLTGPMTLPPSPVGYLIITHDDFTAGLDEFVSLKEQKGLDVTVTPLSDISPSTPTGIQTYIREAYDTWEIPPTFVLLVGDEDFVPCFQGSDSNSATDLYYAQMNPDDYLMDLSVGRLTVRNTTHLADVIDKIVYYEENPPLLQEWTHHAVFMASLDNYEISEGTHNYVIENYLEPAGITCHKIYARLGGDTQDIFDNLNEGRRIANYSGHGSTTGWYNPAFDQSNVNSLENDGMYPFVISNACLTGDFEQTECFGETWLIAANKGAIAHWGASSYTYWDEDDILEKKLWRCAFEDSVFAIGQMTDQALIELYEHYGGGGLCQYYFEVYNVFGDPSVELYTVAPDEIRGIVRNSTTGDVIESVLVEVLDLDKSDYTDEYGYYSIKADFPESVQVAASFIGYEADTEWVEVTQEGVTYHNIWMSAINPGALAGHVTDLDTGEPIGGIVSVYSGHLELTHTTIDDATGYYELEVPEGTWTVTVDPENPYMNVSEPNVVIAMGDTTYLDFELAALTEFVDVSGAVGILTGGFSEGASFVDYDDDGDEDIFVVDLVGDDRMYRNDGGVFTEVAASIGLAGVSNGFAGIWGDYDRDGDMDCYLTRRNGFDILYRNDGGVFTDVTAEAGVGGEETDYSQSAAWLDIDDDGKLDLYTANRFGANRLYHNIGGTFEEAGTAWGVDDMGAAKGVCVADFDNDGDSDIYVVNMIGDSNILYRNDGSVFTDVSDVAGVADTGDGRGCCWGDVDGDGDMDLFVANDGADVLYLNEGGIFTDVTALSGVGDTGSAFGCSMLDYDRDGDMDIIVATGTKLLLYLNDGAGNFDEVSDLVGLAGGLGVGIACGDYDGDNDLDVYVARSNYTDDLLFANGGNNNTWLNVGLRGFASDKNGIGSRIEAWAGTRVYVREVVTGTGLYSQDSILSEFGLGRETNLDSLVVSWPSGRKSKLVNIAADQSIVVSEGGFVAVPVQRE